MIKQKEDIRPTAFMKIAIEEMKKSVPENRDMENQPESGSCSSMVNGTYETAYRVN